jgi:hypothetical protein
MNEEYISLGKRAAACKGWRWMPGMRGVRSFFHPSLGEHVTVNVRIESSLDVELIETPSRSQELVSSAHCTVSGWTKVSDLLPDLTDPATLGCLLALVREAWGMPTGITVTYSSDLGLWRVSWSGATHGGWCGQGKTEAEALINALENAFSKD